MLGRRAYQLEADKVTLLEARTSELEQQLEERVATLTMKAEREALMVELGKQIRTALNVHDIIDITAQELPTLLRCDRVMVGRLTTQNGIDSLEVIDGTETEDSEDLGVYLSLNEVGLDRAWVQRYTMGEQCVVMKSTGCENCPPMIDGLDAAMRAKVVMPIVVDKSLWGLLIVQA
ncbi:MAG: GAF domain-containing protein, partial [Coleofasciculaceae cyanobacterium RL_1_1]|nr:GAF domain-containing protein [Coleofasciculaceae cyanobacterium RL_1_1]